MKAAGRFGALLLGLLLAACLEPSSRSSPAPKVVSLPDVAIARVALAEPPVQIDRGSGTFEAALVGEELRPGDHVRTGPNGFARVDLFTGGGVRLLDSAEIELKSMAKTGKLRSVPSVAVLFGTVRGFLDPPAPGTGSDPPRLYLRSNTAPIIVEARGDKPLLTRVTRTRDGLETAVVQGEGAVVLNGQERLLTPGQFVDVVAGELTLPRALPPPPELLEPTGDERFFCPGLVVRLSWKPPSGTSASLVQVARDAHFQSLALTGETAADHTLFVPRAPGHYFWRVATRDADGRAGEYGAARPLFCEATAPEDLLSSPPDGATVMLLGHAKLSFAWKAVPGAQTYRLLVFKGAALRINEILDRTAHDTTLSVDALEEGEYVWGVWAQDAGERPLFVSPRKLTVLRSRARPPSEAPEGGE